MDARDALNRPSLRALLLLAWPVILSRATQSIVGFSDALMVAPLGKESLAAVTTGAFDSFVIFLFPMGLVFILQSFTAQLRGRGELGAMRRYANYGFVISAVAALTALSVVPFIPATVGLFGYDENVARPMSNYIAIRMFGVGAAVGIEALGNWFGGLGNTRVALAAGVATMLANILGNYLLIEPRFGLPGYGVEGSAVASVAASWVGLVVALLAYRRAASVLPHRGARFDRAEFARVLRFGAPNGLNMFLELAAFAIFVNVVVGGLGTTELAAMNIVFQVNGVAFMPAFGLGTAAAILVGESIGRGDKDGVPRIVLMAGLVCGAWMTLVGSLYFVFPEEVIGVFAVSTGPELVQIGATMLVMSVGWQLFDAVGITLGEALRGAGDTTFCMLARLLIAWVVFLPLSLYLVGELEGGTEGAIISVIVYLAVLAVALLARFLSGRWRNIELVPDELEQV